MGLQGKHKEAVYAKNKKMVLWLIVLEWGEEWKSQEQEEIKRLRRVRTRSTKDSRRSRLPERLILHLFLHSAPTGKRNFLLPPCMARSTADAVNIVWDHDGKLDEVSQDKKQKVATGLLCDKLRTQDFAEPISLRASKVPGPISRYRIADILHHMKLASCASRLGLTVGFLRILCNGLCAAQRFHTEGDEHTCRVGCPNEPDPRSLLITTNALSCAICLFLFGEKLLGSHGEAIFSMT